MALDTTLGQPAVGMRIELWSLAGEQPRRLKSTRTNNDGRTDERLLKAEEMQPGRYELLFVVGNYFAGKVASVLTTPFLDRVPIRFGIAEAAASYHVPLRVCPWGTPPIAAAETLVETGSRLGRGQPGVG